MGELVFCNECKYLKVYLSGYECEHPSNTKANWYSRDKMNYKDRPEHMNADNDCKRFEAY